MIFNENENKLCGEMDQVKSQVALVKLLREKALHNITLVVISSPLS
jgi:hypothetical protein